jgi:hypothetical protein
MVQALNQFLCGISLQTGTTFVAVLNFLLNIGLILVAVFNVIMPLPLFILNFEAQIFLAMGFFGLLGMPFVLAGLFGAYTHNEPTVRIYLLYLWVAFVVLIFGPMVFMAVKNPCKMLLPGSMQGARGSAQACGSLWVSLYGVGGLVAGVILYLIFTVWSYCQELAVGGGKLGLPILVEAKKRKGTVSGGSIFGTGAAITLAPSLPVDYSSCASMGIGGSTALFNVKGFHETDFPPPAKV